MTDQSQEKLESPGRAVAYLMMGISSGLCLDITAKWLLQDYALVQFVFLRSIFGIAFLLFVVRQFGGVSSLRTNRWPWHLLRTALAAAAKFGFFYGISQMPLVNALTVGFTAPLMVTALSVPFLGERVGWRRWTAVAVGFVGVVVVLRPEAGALNVASLAVLGSAFAYACLAITARHLASTESSYSLSIYVIAGPMVISASLLPGKWVTPSLGEWGLFAFAGLASAIAWIGIVGGYRRASPALLAPFEYTALIGGAIAGYVIWKEVPDRWVVVGGAIIIASGLFVVYREVGQAISSRYLRGFSAGGAAAMARRLKKNPFNKKR
ncbi:MAG: DMT family transporter [Pseudomonadota bacterium]